jgi:interleukin-1 receptor-associated kinase 1
MLSLSCIAYAAAVILGRTCSCLQFTYSSFNTTNIVDFNFSPGSEIANGSLQITPNTGDIMHRSGRVVYARETLKPWNSKGTTLTSFRTEFVLNILPQNGTGEGMAFMLTNKPLLPRNSSGQWLGVCNNQTDGALVNRVIAMEFDTKKSNEDALNGNYFGFDFNSMKSVRQ